MDRKAFLALLQRYLDGTCSSEEKQVIDYWYESLDQAREEKGSLLSRGELEVALWEKIQQRIEPAVDASDNINIFRRQRVRYYQFAAAACVLIIFGFFYSNILRPILNEVRGGELHPSILADTYEEKNTGAVGKWVLLEDSTQILLEPGSSIHYSKPFSKKSRTVYLTGDAFFDVAKDAERSFMVYSGDIVTRVVGTSFKIRSAKSNIEVAVVTGRVVVERASDDASNTKASKTDGVVLSPNQKVTYFAKNKYFTTELVETPALLATHRSEKEVAKLFQFEDTPLTDVLDRIEAAYGVEIVLANDSIANCPITADLSQQPLFTKLDIISAVLRAEFEVKGTDIILLGGSCD